MYTRTHIIVDRKSRALLQPLSFLNSWSSWLWALRGCICTGATLLWPTQVVMHCYMDVFVQLQPYYGHTGLYSPDFGFCGTRATMSLCFNLFCNSNDCDIVSGTRKRGHGDRNKTKYCAWQVCTTGISIGHTSRRRQGTHRELAVKHKDSTHSSSTQG